MTNVEVLSRFFEAENARNWDRYQTFLHPEVVWELHGDGVRVIHRVEEYLAVIKAAYTSSCSTSHKKRHQGNFLSLESSLDAASSIQALG